MARSLGQAKRGRNKETLRLSVAEMAAKVTAGNGTVIPSVEVHRDGGPVEVLTYDAAIPKGSVLIPFEMTATKNAANVRELVRLALIDAGLTDSVGLHREHFAFDPINGEAGYVPTTGEKRKGYKEPKNAPESPEGDAWALIPRTPKADTK